MWEGGVLLYRVYENVWPMWWVFFLKNPKKLVFSQNLPVEMGINFQNLLTHVDAYFFQLLSAHIFEIYPLLDIILMKNNIPFGVSTYSTLPPSIRYPRVDIG